MKLRISTMNLKTQAMLLTASIVFVALAMNAVVNIQAAHPPDIGMYSSMDECCAQTVGRRGERAGDLWSACHTGGDQGDQKHSDHICRRLMSLPGQASRPKTSPA